MCKDETSASGSLKLDIAGSQDSILRGKKNKEICLSIYYTNSNSPVFLHKKVAAWLSSFCTIALVCRLWLRQDCIRKYFTQVNVMFF